MRRSLFLIPLASILACAATDPSGDAPPGSDVKANEPAPIPGDAPATDAGADRSDAAAPKKNACNLAAMSGVSDVEPAFIVGAPAATAGGTLDGQYEVKKATVFLPSASAGLVDPDKSTGSINGWAVFDGSRYRLHLKADFTVSTIAGPQSQGVDTESQGGFTTSGSELLLDHACDTAIANEADYSFTDTGKGSATILIKTSTPYGDIFLQLDAAKN